MALKNSTTMTLGATAPAFNLLNTVNGETLSLATLKSDKATVIFFICNHCPFVLHINKALVALANKYQAQGVQFIGISSNNVATHPQDGPEYMKKTALHEGYPFPYLYDETQKIAKAYNAVCTPEFFVFDKKLACIYSGRFDATRPNNGVASGSDLSNCLDKWLLKEEIIATQIPSMGCGIKWK